MINRPAPTAEPLPLITRGRRRQLRATGVRYPRPPPGSMGRR